MLSLAWSSSLLDLLCRLFQASKPPGVVARYPMKDGIGLAGSLWTEAKRFTQRAVASFYRYEREFVIDAAAAAEYLAKHRIVERDPVGLYTARRRNALSEAQRYIIETPRTL